MFRQCEKRTAVTQIVGITEWDYVGKRELSRWLLAVFDLVADLLVSTVAVSELVKASYCMKRGEHTLLNHILISQQLFVTYCEKDAS